MTPTETDLTVAVQGQANQAFEFETIDNANHNETKTQVTQVTADDPEAEAAGNTNMPNNRLCRLFGVVALPDLLQKHFLYATWFLVFLSWAASIQVDNLSKHSVWHSGRRWV